MIQKINAFMTSIHAAITLLFVLVFAVTTNMVMEGIASTNVAIAFVVLVGVGCLAASSFISFFERLEEEVDRATKEGNEARLRLQAMREEMVSLRRERNALLVERENLLTWVEDNQDMAEYWENRYKNVQAQYDRAIYKGRRFVHWVGLIQWADKTHQRLVK